MAGVAACPGGVETGKAWTLNAINDPNRLQAKIVTDLFDMGAVSLSSSDCRSPIEPPQPSRCRASRQHGSAVKPNSLIFANTALLVNFRHLRHRSDPASSRPTRRGIFA